MGGGKRKFNTVRKKFVPKDKQLGKFEEEKKEHNPEDVKDLLSLWGSMKKKKEDDK